MLNVHFVLVWLRTAFPSPPSHPCLAPALMHQSLLDQWAALSDTVTQKWTRIKSSPHFCVQLVLQTRLSPTVDLCQSRWSHGRLVQGLSVPSSASSPVFMTASSLFGLGGKRELLTLCLSVLWEINWSDSIRAQARWCQSDSIDPGCSFIVNN